MVVPSKLRPGTMLGRAAVVWLGVMIVAVMNGAVREALLVPLLGRGNGHLASTLLLMSAVILAAVCTIRWIQPGNFSGAVKVGITWLTFTLAFEFLAGHYLFGNPWEELLADYDVLDGRIWPLIPLATLIAPTWAWRRQLLRRIS